MSSPPALDFPSSDLDDVEMGDGTVEESMPNAPPIQEPLFLAASPSTAGTPAHRWGSNAPQSSPLRGIIARRAVGLSTPKKTPLFSGQ
jgi:DNA replication licensing factor MCM4